MFIAGHLLEALAKILNLVFQLAILLFLARALLSWFQPDPRQPVIAFIYQITDPILDQIRRMLPTIGAVDLSPMVAILICYFLKIWLVKSLADLGYHLLR